MQLGILIQVVNTPIPNCAVVSKAVPEKLRSQGGYSYNLKLKMRYFIPVLVAVDMKV